MTQIVNPSIDRVADSFLTAGSLAYAGLRDGGIVPSGQQTELAKQSAADETVLNGFAFSTSGLDVTVSAGEAFVFGSWIIKDTQTTVTLPASSTTKVYVGWNKDAANSVIIGPISDFEDEDAKIEVGGFTTDSSTITSESDLREFVSIDAERLEGKDTSEIATDVSDNSATVVENVGDINVEGGLSASDDGDGSATIVGEAQYTDADAINAANNESSLSVNISGDSNSVGGFNFVKNGNNNIENINYTVGVDASGGNTIFDTDVNGTTKRIHEFYSSSSFQLNNLPNGVEVDYIIVGGGGGSGNNDKSGGQGGGGGGGVSIGTITSQGTYSVTVGAGGSVGSNGGDSSIDGIDSAGGGDSGTARGQCFGGDGGSSGFGDFGNNSGGSDFTTCSGSDRASGGGGGAVGNGENASTANGGDGGVGYDASAVVGTSSGESGYFGGGGGGTNGDNGGVPSGGLGGGGDGAKSPNSGQNGLPNTGGGAGGGHNFSTNGGSGVVIFAYEV